MRHITPTYIISEGKFNSRKHHEYMVGYDTNTQAINRAKDEAGKYLVNGWWIVTDMSGYQIDRGGRLSY